MYLTLQGEGTTAGDITYFIRTSRCNMVCPWCDTNFKSPTRKMTVDEIIKEVEKQEGCHAVCLTGGEPLLEKDAIELENKLVEMGYLTVVETNGSMDVSGIRGQVSMDVKCPGSTHDGFIKLENFDVLLDKDQIKFVIGDLVDYDYAKSMLKHVKKGQVLFMPVWDDECKMAKELGKWITEDRLNVRLALQLHKILNVR